MHRLAVLGVAILLSACGGDSDPTNSGTGGSTAGGTGPGGAGGTSGSGGSSSGGTAGTGGAGGTGVDGPLVPASTTVGVDVDSGDENTVCFFQRLDNADPGYIRKITGTLTPGSHHMIVYLSKRQDEKLTPSQCSGFSGLISGQDVPVFIAQKADEVLQMPTDVDTGKPVGIKIEANQMLRIEFHYYNTTPSARRTDGTFKVDLAPLSTDVTEGQFSFWGTRAFTIPPQSKHETPQRVQIGLPGTKIFGVTTHQHQFAERMRIWHAPGGEATGEPLADNSDWAEPPLEMLDPPVAIGEGDGLAYQCAWNNTTDKEVGFGEGFNEEMCFLWAYYYPSQGFDICFDNLCPNR